MLLKEPMYDECVKKIVRRYKLSRIEVKNCSKNIFDILSKHADDGNILGELTICDTHYSMAEVAGIESVFCTLKEMEHIYFPLRIQIK